MAVWQANPRTFGLKGYAEQYPDSNKVLTQPHGREGPGPPRLARQDGPEALLPDPRGPAGRAPAAPGGAAAGRRRKPWRCRATRTSCCRRCSPAPPCASTSEGRKQELTFADACRFWSITENLAGPALDARLQALRTALADDRAHGRQGRPGHARRRPRTSPSTTPTCCATCTSTWRTASRGTSRCCGTGRGGTDRRRRRSAAASRRRSRR